MDDLITREEAYITLTEYYHHRTEIQHKALREALDSVPFVQPEITLESAIDYLHRIGWMQSHDKQMYEDGQRHAQPEIIHCRDCKKRMKLSCPFGITVFDAPDDDEFCSRAERRTDESD